ncbi:hypothetical protein [Varunaivibrio sulfuroxidans]|uniref:Flagellin-like hook-associated protein FlgL n=1 Tax=Varunaivibrio sulfuroxidans TaxID=1773489 RepID=A0A4R3JBC5_9PROT|nr:hypothetical protein [Varunaivibrio sulfuroxidans]TCS63002.1 flagellin-like hook-associated protein FlgL [Varunaivibrio sulfuroxidans]WES31920.1 hypothetical protein P3M64_06075 [Varunaivibrio sulfuroxidans]
MVNRISTRASNTQLLSYLYKTQTRLQDLQYQMTSQKLSPDFKGISGSSKYLLSLKNKNDAIAGYMKNNDIMNTRLDVTSSAMDGIDSTFRDFKKLLGTFNAQTGKSQQDIKNIQDSAYRSLLSIQAYLNTSVGGEYVFSGARANTKPVDLGSGSLTDFQAKYDGAAVTYPTTRDADIANFSLNRDANNQANWLTFKQDDDGNAATAGVSSITATTAQFANLKVGSTIDVTGTANNNGAYTIKAITGGGTTIQVETRMLTNENNVVPAVVTLPDGTTLDSSKFTDLTFNRAGDSITAAAAGSLSSLAVGSTFTVSGTAQNNGTYTVAGNTAGTTVTIVPKKMVDEGTAATPTLAYTGSMTITHVVGADDTIAAGAGTFSNVTPGMRITIAGATNAANNNTFTVTSVAADGSSIGVREDTLVTEVTPGASTASVPNADGAVSSVHYYSGDNLTLTHRVDDKRDFKLDVTAISPAFEKGIRALALIAQGKLGTEGGLDQNLKRGNDAMYLLSDAIDGSGAGASPYGAELAGNVNDRKIQVGYAQVLLKQATDGHTKFSGFLEAQIAKTENSDPLKTLTQVLDDQRALEASYQTLARIRQLSLSKYM